MDPEKRRRLEAAGYRIFDDAADWLGLTAEERAEVELRNALHYALQRRCDEQKLTARKLATRLKVTPSQAARIVDASAYVSLDVVFAALFALGGKLADLTEPSTPAAAPPPPRPGRRTQKAAVP